MRTANHRKNSEEETFNVDTLMMLKSTLEATDNGILVVSENGKILHCNKHFIQMWKIPKSIADTNDDNLQLELVAEQLVDPESFLQNVRNLYASSEAEALDVLNFKDGRVFERATSPMMMNGKPAGRVWSFRDITKRKKAEDALIKSEEKLALALQVSIAGIWEWNLLDYHVSFDNQFHAILGYEPGELPDTFEEWLTYHHPDDRDKMMSTADSYLRGQIPFYESEHRIRTKTGEWAWVFTRGQATSLSNGTAKELFIGIAMNVTQRKQNEEELARHREHLEEIVEKRTAELIETNKELESFSYSVSHDLRAPLRSISGYSQVVLEDYANIVDDTGKQYLNTIRNSCRQMDELIDNLLKLSRINSSQLFIEPVNLSELSTSITDKLKEDQPDRQIEIHIQDGIIVQGDQKLLSIALINLFSNAWKFTSHHSQGIIEFGSKSINGNTVYFIRDNGVGFDMKDKDRLFIPFQRLHSDKEFAGTGIGLSIVNRIIKRHGGRIWAEAEKEEGATFFFSF